MTKEEYFNSLKEIALTQVQRGMERNKENHKVPFHVGDVEIISTIIEGIRYSLRKLVEDGVITKHEGLNQTFYQTTE